MSPLDDTLSTMGKQSARDLCNLLLMRMLILVSNYRKVLTDREARVSRLTSIINLHSRAMTAVDGAFTDAPGES